MGAKKTIQELLSQAGVTIDGDKPFDIKVHNPHLYSRVMAAGSLGLGEAYMAGWWDVKKLDVFFYKLLSSDLEKEVKNKDVAYQIRLLLNMLKSKAINLQSKNRAFEVGEKHYDTGNDLFKAMLDKRMVYSCGYWRKAKNLNEAQEHKLDLICKKLQLKKGMSLLDIGCGWGSLAKFAANKYGVQVTGVTISKEQAKFAKKSCKGLPVEILIKDYRDLTKTYDRVVSVGMFEHVGYKNYKQYMKVAHRVLADDGLFLLHTIGRNVTRTTVDPWINKYFFPNGMLPSIKQIATAAEPYFITEDLHNFGPDYDKTLMAWYKNFNRHWPKLKKKYGGKFYRMWTYYLLSCAAAFRARNTQLWQFVFSKKGRGQYRSIR